MPDVFLSYARSDSVFVRGLADELERAGKTVWIDTEGIGDGEVFPEAIRTAIEGSDAFLFVITPASVASRYCETEVEYADSLHKRLVPVLREPVADDQLPEQIRVRSWVPFGADVSQEGAVARLIAALDLEHFTCPNVTHGHVESAWVERARPILIRHLLEDDVRAVRSASGGTLACAAHPPMNILSKFFDDVAPAMVEVEQQQLRYDGTTTTWIDEKQNGTIGGCIIDGLADAAERHGFVIKSRKDADLKADFLSWLAEHPHALD